MCAVFFCVSIIFCFYWVDKQFFVIAHSPRSLACHFKHFIGFRNSNCIRFVNINSLNACTFAIPSHHWGGTAGESFGDYVKRDFNYRAHFNSSIVFIRITFHYFAALFYGFFVLFLSAGTRAFFPVFNHSVYSVPFVFLYEYIDEKKNGIAQTVWESCRWLFVTDFLCWLNQYH